METKVTGLEILTNYQGVRNDLLEVPIKQQIKLVISCLANGELTDLVSSVQPGEIQFKEVYTTNFNQFFNSLDDKSKCLFTWEALARVKKSKNKVNGESAEERFVTNRVVFDGGIEEIYMSGRVNEWLREYEKEGLK